MVPVPLTYLRLLAALVGQFEVRQHKATTAEITTHSDAYTYMNVLPSRPQVVSVRINYPNGTSRIAQIPVRECRHEEYFFRGRDSGLDTFQITPHQLVDEGDPTTAEALYFMRPIARSTLDQDIGFIRKVTRELHSELPHELLATAAATATVSTGDSADLAEPADPEPDDQTDAPDENDDALPIPDG